MGLDDIRGRAICSRIMEAPGLGFYFANGDCGGCLQPEKRLMFAVLQDAVECFQNCKFEPRSKPTNEFLDSEEWIFGDDRKWPFSFINICEAVGMDPAGLRQGLLRWKENTLRTNILVKATSQAPERAAKARPSGYHQSMANGGL
jgi:hypothetical protein